MHIISVDIETDGDCPHIYSMLSIGAVNVVTGDEFYSTMRPIGKQWKPEAMKVNGFSREEVFKFPEPAEVMQSFYEWTTKQQRDEKGRLLFMSDNAGFDWQFVNYYFHKYIGMNPFGYSPMSLTWFAKGLGRDLRTNEWKRLRRPKHTHNALDDAKGNAHAFSMLQEKYNL